MVKSESENGEDSSLHMYTKETIIGWTKNILLFSDRLRLLNNTIDITHVKARISIIYKQVSLQRPDKSVTIKNRRNCVFKISFNKI